MRKESKMGVIQHIHFTIDWDFTCWGESMENFENCTDENLKNTIIEFCIDKFDDVPESIKINEVWYEDCDY